MPDQPAQPAPPAPPDVAATVGLDTLAALVAEADPGDDRTAWSALYAAASSAGLVVTVSRAATSLACGPVALVTVSADDDGPGWVVVDVPRGSVFGRYPTRSRAETVAARVALLVAARLAGVNR